MRSPHAKTGSWSPERHDSESRMKPIVPRWIKRAFLRETTLLIVEGQLVEARTHQPRTRLGAEPSPPEVCFTLEISRAQLSDGSPRSVDQVFPPEFAGPIDLLEQFKTGDWVRITTTTATGRRIERIEPLSRDR